MKVAIEGCAHGELDKIYESIELLEKDNDIKVDLLLICGDFQAVRNTSDLQCMAVPPKYQKLNTFYKYYSGEKKAPVLTIFVGGNHEASNYLSELPYGGWVCPNIFYMGYANVINVNGIRIGGLSGIYKGQDYLKGHFEVIPYDESSKRSVYHVRNVDVFRLKQIKKPIDMFMSHDWPRNICNYGDKDGLLRFKPFLKDDIENEKLGSRPAEELLFKLSPSYWFAAHLHCKFAALIPHEKNGVNTCTKFLALDKCLPRRKFLQIIDIGEPCIEPLSIEYDPEWLAILQSTNHLLNVTKQQSYMPGPGCSERWDFSPSEDEIEEVKQLFASDLKVPLNFEATASPHNASEQSSRILPEIHINPQTVLFCKTLGITDPIQMIVQNSPGKLKVKEFSVSEDANVTNTSQASLNLDDSAQVDSASSGSDEFSTEGKSSDLDTTGSSGFFYIDTRPRRNLLTSSPQNPKLSFEERWAMFADKSLDSSSKSSILQDFPEFNEQSALDDNENQEAEESSVTPVKQFKRRNQAMYKSVEEDQEESQ